MFSGAEGENWTPDAGFFRPTLYHWATSAWCGREDLNLHPLRDMHLKHARIPIPPHPPINYRILTNIHGKGNVVGQRGLEPPRIAPYGSEPYAYTNSATSPSARAPRNPPRAGEVGSASFATTAWTMELYQTYVPPTRNFRLWQF